MNFTDDNNIESRKKQIILLVKTYYNKFDFLRDEELDVLIQKSLDLFLESDLSIEEINNKMLEIVFKKKKELDSRYDDKNVIENHKEIYSKLEQLFKGLNKEGADCLLAGALCGYLKYGEESARCHDDIDVFINEEDIDKFKNVCVKMGLMFEDNRLNSLKTLKNGIPYGEHEVIARSTNSDFHVGVFCFERASDGSIINRRYYHDVDGKSCVHEEITSPELSSLIYGSEEVEFRGVPISIVSPEYIYHLKSFTKERKDLNDISFLEDKIDKKKLKKIVSLEKGGKVVQNVSISSLPCDTIHNKYDDDLELMMEDEQDYINEAGAVREDGMRKDKNKVYVKNNIDRVSSDESGFGSSTTFSTLSMISFVLCALIFIILYLIRL